MAGSVFFNTNHLLTGKWGNEWFRSFYACGIFTSDHLDDYGPSFIRKALNRGPIENRPWKLRLSDFFPDIIPGYETGCLFFQIIFSRDFAIVTYCGSLELDFDNPKAEPGSRRPILGARRSFLVIRKKNALVIHGLFEVSNAQKAKKAWPVWKIGFFSFLDSVFVNVMACKSSSN